MWRNNDNILFLFVPHIFTGNLINIEHSFLIVLFGEEQDVLSIIEAKHQIKNTLWIRFMLSAFSVCIECITFQW